MFATRKVPALLSLLLALALGACEAPPAADSLTSPRPEAAPTESRASLSSYRLVEGQIPASIGDLSVSKLIGLDGGSVHLAGHSIEVPAGAVSQPAVFSITLRTNGFVEVDVKALALDALGNSVNVGAQGFSKPVALTLTYAWASNVSDPSRLLILRRLGGDKVEPMRSTVDTKSKTVTAQLDHFSHYCMATN